MAITAIRQSCGLRGVIPCQRQRANSSAAAACVAALGRVSNRGRARKFARNRSKLLASAAPCRISWTITEATAASPRSSRRSSSATGAERRWRSSAIQIVESTRITTHNPPDRAHVVIRCNQSLPDQPEYLALFAACDKIPQRDINRLTLRFRTGKTHGLLDQAIVENDVRAHIHLRMCILARPATARKARPVVRYSHAQERVSAPQTRYRSALQRAQLSRGNCFARSRT